MQTSKIRFNADRKERDISVDHLYKWALRGEDVGIKCSTALTGGKEKYHGTKRDMKVAFSIITCAFCITKGGYPVGTLALGIPLW